MRALRTVVAATAITFTGTVFALWITIHVLAEPFTTDHEDN